MLFVKYNRLKNSGENAENFCKKDKLIDLAKFVFLKIKSFVTKVTHAYLFYYVIML